MPLQKRLGLLIIAVVLIFIIVISGLVFAGSFQNNGKIESLDIAYSPFESLGLFWVAQDQGFFIDNGLNVTAHKYDSGAAALSAVIDGKVDIAVGPAEFPLVVSILSGEKVQSLATISKSNFIYLVGRADSGIVNVSDLRGKVIGTTFGTISHYFLGRFLVLNGLDMAEVTLVDLRAPSEWVNAVVNGSVDAVATAQPAVNSAMTSLGDNAVVWSLNSGQPHYAQTVAKNDWIEKNPEICRLFLQSLYQAEQFTTKNPSQALAIIKQVMNFSDAYMENVTSQNQYSLSLDPSLLLAMENEARWLIGNKLTSQLTLPDFLNNIYTDSLLSVKPESVTITLR
jgi:sulfonate transport system substrate-binding protein